MDSSTALQQWKHSLDNFEDYPINLTPHNAITHNAQTYVNLLNKREESLFCSEQSVQCQLRFWQCEDQMNGFHGLSARNLNELDFNLRTKRKDPISRFVFISAPSQRSALNVTRQMAEFLFSFHQVMPSYLDFVVTFGKRHYAQEFPYSGFRQQLRLSDSSRGQMIGALGRSGQDLSLCYNLMSVEQSQDKWPWSIRQTAIYHSFDTCSGRATWIVTKANLLMEKRIQEATTRKIPAEISQFGTNSQAFSANLLTHLTFIDWAGENWRWYIDFLEDKAQDLTRQIPQMSVHKLQSSAPASPTSPCSLPTRSTTRSVSWRLSSMMSEKTLTESMKTFSPHRLPSICTSLFPKPDHQQTSPAPTLVNQINTQEEGFRIDDLQENQFLEDKTNETMLIIDANLSILDELTKFYKSVLNSNDCPQEIRTRCQADFDRFESRVQGVQNELRMQKSRAKSILRLLSDRKHLLFGILEYQNMEASRILAQKAQTSADEMKAMTKDMHNIARKTEQETVSMRVITLVTLFFLPGTFISTLMSTDIIRWQSDPSRELEKTVSLGALKFFMEITIPLMVSTFVAWWVVYRCVKRKESNQPMDIESQVYPQPQRIGPPEP